MERMDVGDDERLSALVEAAARGEEAVLTRDGEVVAHLVPRAADREAEAAPTVVLKTRDGREPSRGIDWAALDALHASLPASIRGANTAALISEMRDMDVH